MRHFLLLFPCLAFTAAFAQTLGVVNITTDHSEGHVLFAPIPSTTTYLIDKCGHQVHSWPSGYRPGQAVYLLDDGSLMRTGNLPNNSFNGGGRGGMIERIAWDGTVLWSYQISDALQCAHHDIHVMPNGHILVIAWEKFSIPEALAAGRNPALLGTSVWSEKIVELEPVAEHEANIVWEWHLWDHLVQEFDSTKANYAVVAAHPELMDLNYVKLPVNADWIHLNSIDYNAELDQIVLSSHNINELWVIDHSTSTAEAASHTGGTQGRGGDLLYRWGDPQAYDRGTTADRVFFGQHHIQWIDAGLPRAGDMLIFNNGLGRPDGAYSSIDILVPAMDANGGYPIAGTEPHGPAALDFTWTAEVPTSFYALNISGVQALANGGFMACHGPAGTFIELDANGEEVWRYVSPVNINGPMTQGDPATGNTVFRCTYITPGHPGLQGHDLTPGAPIELQPLPDPCIALTTSEVGGPQDEVVFPQPANSTVQVQLAKGRNCLSITDAQGRMAWMRTIEGMDAPTVLDISMLPGGTYVLQVQQGEQRWTRPLVVLH
jgi:hypothetical protein